MIQANELRVGNVLSFTAVNNHLVLIEADMMAQICSSPTFINCFSPIPLTPEVLERCGWMSHYGEKYSWYISPLEERGIQLRNVHYRQTKMEYEWEVTTKHSDRLATVVYLHTLQNLFYALTGTQLNYKP